MKLIRSPKKEKSSDEIKNGGKADPYPRGSELTDSAKFQKPAVDLDINNWRVLLVDDEPDVHEVTRIALRGFTFDDKNIELISAYSAEQAREILRNDQDFSAAVIDVVMEAEEAGLDLVRFIREEMGLSHIRLIIRTGQPGKFPEQFVIKNYDIDDYKEKSDLTTTKMHTMLRSSIKAYRDIWNIDRRRIKELHKANKKLEATVYDLNEALRNVRKLSGLLPICSYCKSIRDNSGYWNQVEAYIENNSDVDFSHSICPKCAEKYHPDMKLYDD